MCLRFLYFIFFIYFAKTDGKYRFDYSYNKDVGGWLKLHRVPATFMDAYFRCNLEGAKLASPVDEHHQKVMVAMQRASNVDCAIFTGIHATFSKGDFETIDGVPLSEIPVKWALDEPNNLDNEEDCIIMLSNGTVADVRCNDTYPYICYKKKLTTPVVTGCGTVDTGYNLEPTTGSCYKFHPIGVTWRRAAMTCHAEGGHLAIINSVDEASVLTALFQKYPSNTIKTVAGYVQLAFIGFKALTDSEHVYSDWHTVHGQSLEEAGYAVWEANNPESCQKCYCGGLSRSGRLNHSYCEYPHSFICEKAPESLIKDDDE